MSLALAVSRAHARPDTMTGGAEEGYAGRKKGATMDDKPHTWRDMFLFWATIILGLTAILLIQEHTVSLLQIVVAGVVLIAVYLVGRYSALP